MSPPVARRGGFLRALAAAGAVALGGMLAGEALAPSSAPAAAPFQWRGVIQGQYGPQFNSAQRRRLLRFMGREGYNAYVHAPKDDPYQRTVWRDPYPLRRQARLDAEVRLASRLGIEWIVNVSPAAPRYSSPGDSPPRGRSRSTPICFSSDADLAQLLAKLEPFREAGTDAFMVSFDDARRRFRCGADRAAYGTGGRAFGHANADLLDRLYARLRAEDPAARLLSVAADYRGTGDSRYLRGLRERLVPGVELMWTGTRIESRPFGPAAADAYARRVGRTPIVWENWVANDGLSPSGRHPSRVFLGPYWRRPSLVGHVGGFFFNPANQSDLNFLPLATAGEWMRHPRRYRPRRAFLHEVRKLGGRQAPALRAFAEANYSSTLGSSREAPTLRRRFDAFLHARGHGRKTRRAAARLRAELGLAATARRRLRRVHRLEHFVRQARPFLRSARLNANAGLLATDLLQTRGPRRRAELRRRLHRTLRRAARFRAETFGSRAGVRGLAGNVIDRYVTRVRHRTGSHPGGRHRR